MRDHLIKFEDLSAEDPPKAIGPEQNAGQLSLRYEALAKIALSQVNIELLEGSLRLLSDLPKLDCDNRLISQVIELCLKAIHRLATHHPDRRDRNGVSSPLTKPDCARLPIALPSKRQQFISHLTQQRPNRVLDENPRSPSQRLEPDVCLFAIAVSTRPGTTTPRLSSTPLLAPG